MQMGGREDALYIADSLVSVMALLRITSIAAGNMEYFQEGGQDISAVIDRAVAELQECCKVLEAFLGGHGHSEGGPHP